MEDKLKLLGDKLREYRQAAQPEDYGIPRRRRRRVCGLRVDEVAAAIECSKDVIARAEVGKYKLSTCILTKLADHYRVTYAQRVDMFRLADLPLPINDSFSDDEIHPSIQAIIDQLDPYPVFVINYRWDIIGWNQAMALIFGDFSQVPLHQRNIVYYMFAVEDARRFIVDWEIHARRVLAQFRLDHGKHLDDQTIQELITHLQNTSPEFADWWNEKIDVREKTLIAKELNHPELGTLSFQQIGLRPEDFPHTLIGVYYPTDLDTLQRIKIGLAKKRYSSNGGGNGSAHTR